MKPDEREPTATMATSTSRRPLPALAFLLALSLLTALVWWRVIHRSDSAKAATQFQTDTAAVQTALDADPGVSAAKAKLTTDSAKVTTDQMNLQNDYTKLRTDLGF